MGRIAHRTSHDRAKSLVTSILSAATLAMLLAPAAAAHMRPPALAFGSPVAFGAGAHLSLGRALLHDRAWHGPADAAAAPSVAVGADPVGVAADPAHSTVYVANGGSNSVSVIDAATCNAERISGCGQTTAGVDVGAGPLGVAVDAQSHTAYVANMGDATLSMIDTDTCNGLDASGCGQTPPTVPVGDGPVFPVVDPTTNTIYVENAASNTVSAIDGSTCNAVVNSGCRQVATVGVGSGPQAIAVSEDTDTLYVANGNDDTISVIDARHCHAGDVSGCDQTPATVTVDAMPNAIAVDRASGTVFVAVGTPGDDTLGALALIDGTTCNATDVSGCKSAPRTTPVGSLPIGVTENPLTRTVYVLNEEDSTVSVVDAATCNASADSGCRAVAPALAMGFDGGSLDVDPTTNTVYASSQGENLVSVLDGSTCNGTHTSGCSDFAPTTLVGTSPQGIAANPGTDTVYVANRSDNTLSVVNSASCNARQLAGCDRSWPTLPVGAGAQNVAINRRTDTVYVANANDNTVSVLDGASCNAHESAGCGQAGETIAVGAAPFALAVDESTDTMYVANVADNTVSVIDGSVCNAENSTGCGQTHPTIDVGNGPAWVSVDSSTGTVYVANIADNTVSVVDGQTCNGRTSSGCDQVAPVTAVGLGPIGMDVDRKTHTLYVTNIGDSTVSLVNEATCNARHSSGCGTQAPAVAVGGRPFGIAVDQAADDVYVTSIVRSDVELLDADACNATHRRGCSVKSIHERMGGWPGSIALDPAAGTFYVPDNVDAAVSLDRLSRD